MSRKLPLEIQRNYSIKDQDDHWVLKCIVCSQAWQLTKPAKGKAVHGGNVLHLLEHTASHPLPKEEDQGLVKVEEVEEVKVEEVKPKMASVHPLRAVEEKVERRGFVSAERVSQHQRAAKAVEVARPTPISQEATAVTSLTYTVPTQKNPNAYQVEINKGVTKVSNFRNPAYTKFRQVQETAEGYAVALYAANPKHAALVATRLIEQHISAK